jgi:hypothetical protein
MNLTVDKKSRELARAVIITVMKNASMRLQPSKLSEESTATGIGALQIITEDKINQDEENSTGDEDNLDYAKDVLSLLQNIRKGIEEDAPELGQSDSVLPENQFAAVAEEIIALMLRYKLLKPSQNAQEA